MYTPGYFKVEDTAEAHAIMRAQPFAILVTQGVEGLTATHLPTILKVDGEAPLGRIECHLARPNPQWKTYAPDSDALVIFQGPEAYIRPGWYPSKAEHGKVVPTWNYAAVHAYGRTRGGRRQGVAVGPRRGIIGSTGGPVRSALVGSRRARQLPRHACSWDRRVEAHDPKARGEIKNEPEPYRG